MPIHQVLAFAGAGDVSTRGALALRGALRQATASEIFAGSFDADMAGDVRCLSRYRPSLDLEGTIFILYVPAFDPDVMSFILGRPERLVVMFTGPARPPLGAPEISALSLLRERTVLTLADTPSGAEELDRLGFSDVRVAPLPTDPDHLLGVPPDARTSYHLEQNVEGPTLMFAGPLVPSARADDLIKAYHVLVTYLMPEVHLILVGSGIPLSYQDALQTFVEELTLLGAWITGPVALAEKAAFFQRADAFVTASAQPGRCVPAIDAMAFGCPIMARAGGGVAETVEEAGLVVPQDADAMVVAEAMATVLTDATLRSALVDEGYRRLSELNPDRAKAAILGHLVEVV